MVVLLGALLVAVRNKGAVWSERGPGVGGRGAGLSTTLAQQGNGAESQHSSRVELATRLLAELQAERWPVAAAEPVVALNSEYFRELAEAAPELLDRHIGQLGRLGGHVEALRLVARRPELAGLLAAASDPERMARTLADDRAYPALSGLYARHLAEVGDQLAEALERHAPRMRRLCEEGLPGAETMFMFSRDAEGAAAYDRWLTELFSQDGLYDDEERLTSTCQLVLLQGDTLRRWLVDDEEWRQRFGDLAWPRAERLLERGPLTLEQIAWRPEVLRVLARPEGERLVARWGLLPAELLFGDEAYPEALHPALIETLLVGDNSTVAALMEFGHEPLLATLLRRRLSPEVKAAALSQLALSGGRQAELLGEWTAYSDEALADAVGPPPSGPVTWIPLYYTLYEVPKKLAQGRRATWMDAAIAVADPLFLLAGPIGPDDVVKIAGQESIKAAARSGAAKAATRAVVAGAERRAAAKLGAEAAGRLAARESTPWLVSEWLRATRVAAQQRLASSLTMDITGPVRFLLRTTGAGRESFRRLTGLEARLFMRPDQRVLVRLDRFLVQHPAGRFLADTAIAGLVETGLQTKTGEAALRGVIELGQRESDESVANDSLSPPASDIAWQRNAAAWWLLAGSGELETMGASDQAEAESEEQRDE